jgi:FKBP-type peptidyl-prolyl cis-trans isomerase FkpA
MSAAIKPCVVLLALLWPLSAPAQAGAPPAPPAKAPAVHKTPSGLVIEMLQEGKGAQPTVNSTVRVHYRGMFPDGREFDSSFRRGEPIEFPLSGVIKCWTEGVAMMKVGAAARLTCPPAIAYGARGAGGVIPPNATLVFEIQLLGVR